MAKEKFNRNKPHVNIGTIGHVDHGQNNFDGCNHHNTCCRKDLQMFVASTLLIMLRKKKRVVLPSIPLTLEYQTEKRHYAHVDCPGHADYVKNM